MDITNKIKNHKKNKKYCKIYRKVAGDILEENNGYIIDYSKDFILFREVYDFKLEGLLLFPLGSVKKIRYNDNDRYYDKIMHSEGFIKKIKKKHKIDLSYWFSVFMSIKKLGYNVIIENERPDDKNFNIGPIIKITERAVYIQYFNAQGILDKKLTKIQWNKITLVRFDDRYINIFSKYLKKR